MLWACLLLHTQQRHSSSSSSRSIRDVIAQTLCIARDAAVKKKKLEKEKLTLCFPQHPGERARSLLESGHSGVAEQSVFADRRQGTKDLWKGEIKKLSGWVSVVLLVFRPLVVLHGGRFVSVKDAS